MASLSRQNASTGTVPTSAAVLDFICLFTHDLKRKQKRWQDGALKYHTFNKRIMVYDDRGHFIGDAHWQAEAHLDSGDEFELDRGAAIVQVSDCTGQKEQDLTELLDKRARDVEKRRANAGVSRTPRPSAQPTSSTNGDSQNLHFQLRQRPLSDMLGTPSRIGRAVISAHSPFEARQMAQRNEKGDEPRPAKRMKPEVSPPSKSYHARALFGATLTLTPLSQQSRSAQSQIRHKWANTELKSLLSTSNPQLQPQSSPDERPEPRREPADEVIEIVSLPASPPPRQRKLPNPASKVSGSSRKSTMKSVEPNQRAHMHQESVDDLQPPEIPPAIETHRVASKFLPVQNPVPRSSPPSISPSTRQQRRQENIVVLDDDGDVEITDSATGTPKEAEEAPKEVPKKVPKKVLKQVPKQVPMEPSKENQVPIEMASMLSRERSTVRSKEEPRTELRIRSRQRRGLLLMSEKADRGRHPLKTNTTNSAKANPSPALDHPELVCIAEEKQDEAPTSVATADTPALGRRASSKDVLCDATDNDALDNVKQPDEPKFPPVRSPSPYQDNNSPEIDDSPRKVRVSRRVAERQSKPRKRTLPDTSIESESEDTETQPVSKSMRKSESASSGCPSAPRITKMARKSIRSREIIGLVLPNEEPSFKISPLSAPSVTDDVNAAERTCSENANVDKADSMPKHNVQQLPVSSTGLTPVAQPGLKGSSDNKLLGKPSPRLCNPATRGKKAARKEDAAGQLPQMIVQLEPVAPTHAVGPKPVPSRRSSTLPGFTKANGGAWSVHAEDLLGMTRPADKPS